MEHFDITLVRSLVKSKPYCKVDGKYSGPTWKNDIGLQRVPYSIEGVYKLCQKLSDAPDVCMVYGRAIKPTIRNTDRTMSNFEEAPTYLLTLDLDKYEGDLKDEYPTYAQTLKEADNFIRNQLPPEFHDISYILRFSSSFLFRDTKFRTHITFLLEESQYPREIGTWIRRENIPIDPTFYFNLTQPIFTAGPLFKETINPLDKIDGYFPRVSLVQKDNEYVPSGWQPYSVARRKDIDFSKLPHADQLPGQVGSFCRMMPIEKALLELGYEQTDEFRFLSPTSGTGLPGVYVFDNGYCYSHHDNDPITQVGDKIFDRKRESFNAYDLMYGWAKIQQETSPDLMNQFVYLLSEAMVDDHAYQDEVTKELLFRTEWLAEDGYTGENKKILDTLLYDMSKSGLNELSRSYIFDLVNERTGKKVKAGDLKKAWQTLRKDTAFYKNEYDPEAGLRMMAEMFKKKGIVFSHHGGLRGDFWCYYHEKRIWRRLNRDQTDAFVYNHLHEAMPLKKEIPFSKTEQLTRLILRTICEGYGNFKPGRGWAFKGGKIGILMPNLFKKEWTVRSNTRTLKREDKICRELPITYTEWKAASDMPNRFNDFLMASFEEDYEKMNILREFIGYTFADSYALHKFMILEGVPGSGKSILIKVIREALGRNNFAALSLGRMGGQFGLGELPGKKLVVMSEARAIDFNKLRDAVPVILKLTGNDPIDIEAKHKMSATETLEAKFIIVTNRTPVLPDDTGALAQRMIMLRLYKSFRGTEEEIHGLDEILIQEEKASIIKWALLGLEVLNKRKQFDIPKSIQEENSYYTDQLDPLKGFIDKYFNYDENATKYDYVKAPKFTQYFREYLFSIGQSVTIQIAQKRTAASMLRNLDKRLIRKNIRQGAEVYKVLYPLVPRMDLDIEFIAERMELDGPAIRAEVIDIEKHRKEKQDDRD